MKLELCESVIDYNNIYLLVKISAPATVDIDSQSGFDYFAFSYGESFNTQQLLGGARDCRFFEMSEGENVEMLAEWEWKYRARLRHGNMKMRPLWIRGQIFVWSCLMAAK